MLAVTFDKDERFVEANKTLSAMMVDSDKKTKNMFLISMAAGGIVFLALFFGLGFGLMKAVDSAAGPWLIATAAAVIIGAVVGTTVYSLAKMRIAKKYSGFTQETIRTVLGDNVTFEGDKGFSQDTLKALAIFPTDILYQEDHIYGSYEGTAFEWADVQADRRITRKKIMEKEPAYHFSNFVGAVIAVDMGQDIGSVTVVSKVPHIDGKRPDLFDDQFHILPLTSVNIPDRYKEKMTKIAAMFPGKTVFKTLGNRLYIATMGTCESIETTDSSKINEDNRKRICAQLRVLTDIIKA